MENFELSIPENEPKNDLSIIYKGVKEQKDQLSEPIEEIHTSKEEFLRKLRYFNDKANEIKLTNEIYIHDVYPVSIFKEFIQTLSKPTIIVNEKNYSDFYKLSCKYGYHELQKVIETFSQTRPDLQKIVDQYSSDDDQIDFEKEEKISKHLDICLQNENMVNFPISKLNRILNSPKRKLENHHILFEFVKKVIKRRSSPENKEELSILIGSLDYLEMNNDELDEILNEDVYSSIFKCHHAEEKMKQINEERKKQDQAISLLISRIDELDKAIKEEKIKRMQEEKEKEAKYIEINSKFEEQNLVISKCQQKNEELQSIVEKQALDMQNKQIEQNKLISKYQQENQKLQSIVEKQQIKINEIEGKIKRIDQYVTGQIFVDVDSIQAIKGKIKIIEHNSRIDKKKSKLIINTNSSPTLDESEYQNGQLIENLTQEFSFMMKSGSYYVHALIFDEWGNKNEIVSSVVETKGIKPFTFEFTGKVQSVQLPKGSYKLEVWGAEGGATSGYTVSPGLGGYSSGTLNLMNETKVFVYVGEHPTTSKGGWNGGGSAKSPAAGGGGASDISLLGEEGSSEWKNENHLYSRIIVAGGGGGAALDDSPDWAAGCGGGLSGEDSMYKSCPIKGGGQTFVSIVHSEVSKDQGFGVGGSNTLSPSSGGGSGWYGGCAYNLSGGWGPGAAGGSGYTYSSSTASSYPSGCKLNSSFYLTETKTLAGNTDFPNCSGNGQEKGHSGNGYAKITPL